jgi:hypothetical protein
MNPKPYTKTFQDELDWKLLDQLYGVVAQISSFCFETKKFCVTTEFVVLTLMAKFTEDQLDHSIFVAALVISVCFWFLDATAYFYQVKLRGMMESIRQQISSRELVSLVTAGGTRIIAPERANAPRYRRILDAAINHSMWLYAVLITVDLIAWMLFVTRKIS